MASYTDLRRLFTDSDLQNKVEVAVIIAAQAFLANGVSTSAQVRWASAVLANPSNEGRKAYMAVLAANNGASVAAIQSAADTMIQTQVDAVVPQLVTAYGVV